MEIPPGAGFPLSPSLLFNIQISYPLHKLVYLKTNIPNMLAKNGAGKKSNSFLVKIIKKWNECYKHTNMH